MSTTIYSFRANDYPAASSGVSKDIASGCLVAPRGGEYNPKRFNMSPIELIILIIVLILVFEGNDFHLRRR
jgi:hypothetical protein